MIHRYHRFSQIGWRGTRPSLKSVLINLWSILFATTLVAQEPSPTPRPLPGTVEMFTVRTRSEQNRQVPLSADSGGLRTSQQGAGASAALPLPGL